MESETELRFSLDKDFADLLCELNAHGARYLLVGGYVVGAYSEPRATKDLDVFILCTEANSEAVYTALAVFGAPIAGMTPVDFLNRQELFQIGVAPDRVDILMALSGVTFEEIWPNHVVGMVNGTIPVPVISFDDLIKNKLAAGRPQDLADVHKLNRAKELRDRFPAE